MLFNHAHALLLSRRFGVGFVGRGPLVFLLLGGVGRGGGGVGSFAARGFFWGRGNGAVEVDGGVEGF